MRASILCLFLVCVTLATAAEDISFSRQIAPLLTEKCLECHRAGKVKGGYRLDSYEHLMKPGDSGSPAVQPGQPENSELYRLLVVDDEGDRMPKKADPLTEKEISLIKNWIASGAKLGAAKASADIASLSGLQGVKTPEKYPRPLPVTALALDAEQELLATSGYGEVLLWDVSKWMPAKENSDTKSPAEPEATSPPRLTARIQGLSERVNALAWIPQHSLLAVAGGSPGRSGEVWLSDPARRKPAKRLLAGKDVFTTALASSDGTHLYTGGTDNRVHAFHLPEGNLAWSVECHADWITGLSLSPDGKVLATASRDRTAKLIDTDDGSVRATYTGHEAAVVGLAFRGDGRHIVSISGDGHVHLWNLEGNAPKGGQLRLGNEIVTTLLGQGESYVALLTNGLVVRITLKDSALKRAETERTDGAPISAALATANSQILVLGGSDGRIWLHPRDQSRVQGVFIAKP